MWWQILLAQFKSPFIYLLFFAAAIAFYLGELIDGTFIIFFVFLSAALGFVQEYSSHKSIALLKKFLVTHVKVWRGGEVLEIENHELVPGDICILEPGDIIPADLRLFKSDNLLVDESALSGESVPVSKTTILTREATSIHEAINIGFSGTTVLAGKALGVVVGIGSATEMGGIAKLTIETESKGAFEKGIAKLSGFILKMTVGALALLFIANIALKGSAQIGEVLLFSIALAVSVIPEGLPAVATLLFSKGAVRLAKKHVVAKRLSAVEDLGSIEVLCTDKTGTITENKLTVHGMAAIDERACMFYAVLSSRYVADHGKVIPNPFDDALWEKLTSEDKEKTHAYRRLSEIPFDPERKFQSALIENDGIIELVVKGAPEAVLDICVGVSDSLREQELSFVKREGMAGNRTIAVAKKVWKGGSRSYVHGQECDLEYLGVISFIDPIKESAKGAIDRARECGVQIKILTGDGADVAGAVGEKVGLIQSAQEVVIGEVFEKISVGEREKIVEERSVFARVTPEQKYQIIEILQRKYNVGFLGDGINDAPALKIASVALAVNTASDIARDSADIVLLSPSLAVIIDGITGGREIFTNMIKYLKTTLISNFGNFYSVALASLLIPFLPMLPMQILLLNLLTDFPMIALSLDTVDGTELKSPRIYHIKEIVVMSVLFGVLSSVFDFVFFFLFYKHAPAVLQTNWFIGSVLTELILIYAIRTKLPFFKATAPSRILLLLTSIPALIALLLPFTSFGQRVFSFVSPSVHFLGMIVVVSILYFVATELFKQLYYKKLSPRLELVK